MSDLVGRVGAADRSRLFCREQLLRERLDAAQQVQTEVFSDPIARHQRFEFAAEVCGLARLRLLHERKGTSVFALKKDKAVALAELHDDTAVNDFRSHLRGAIDESGLKDEFVASCIGVKPYYLSKMLAQSGEQKPIGAKHLVKLPGAVKCLLVVRLAKELGTMDTIELRMHVSQDMVIGLAGVLGVARKEIA